MAIAVSASGLVLGLAADRLRRFGVKIEHVLASTMFVSMAAQVSLVLGWKVPPSIAWSAIAAAGAATVLSYAILAEYFPKEASGRANAALNVMHVGVAFVLQYVTGLVIEQWPAANDHYAASAHQCAMSLTLMLQIAAVAWFGLASHRRSAPAPQSLVDQVSAHCGARPAVDLSQTEPSWGMARRDCRLGLGLYGADCLPSVGQRRGQHRRPRDRVRALG